MRRGRRACRSGRGRSSRACPWPSSSSSWCAPTWWRYAQHLSLCLPFYATFGHVLTTLLSSLQITFLCNIEKLVGRDVSPDLCLSIDLDGDVTYQAHDVTSTDPKLLVHIKAYRNTVPVPRHWCHKRKYLQGKRGIEKPPFELPGTQLHYHYHTREAELPSYHYGFSHYNHSDCLDELAHHCLPVMWVCRVHQGHGHLEAARRDRGEDEAADGQAEDARAGQPQGTPLDLSICMYRHYTYLYIYIYIYVYLCSCDLSALLSCPGCIWID
jgi:hypothetical protein